MRVYVILVRGFLWRPGKVKAAVVLLEVVADGWAVVGESRGRSTWRPGHQVRPRDTFFTCSGRPSRWSYRTLGSGLYSVSLLEFSRCGNARDSIDDGRERESPGDRLRWSFFYPYSILIPTSRYIVRWEDSVFSTSLTDGGWSGISHPPYNLF